MKKFKSIVAVLLAVIFAFSALAVASFAEEKEKKKINFNDVETLSEGKLVTAFITKDVREVTYKFEPSANGYFCFYSSGENDSYLNIYDESGELVADGDDYIDSANFFCVCKLSSTHKYAVAVGLFDEKDTGLIQINVEGLGEFVSVEKISDPDILRYTIDQDIFRDEEGNLSTEAIDMEGSDLKFTFESKTLDVSDYETYYVFDIESENNDPTKLNVGRNTIDLKISGKTLYSFEIEVEENPLDSMFITKNPDKTDFYAGNDDDGEYDVFSKYFYPYIDLYGMHIRLTYKDGTVKNVVVDEHGVKYTTEDGYYIYGYYTGDETAEIRCLGNTLQYKVNLIKPGFFTKIKLFFIQLIELIKFDLAALKPSRV
ncbi:MAG: hypothetical protein K6F09_06985 [Clostridiales bacterium]|nr:hypothetical protein [Clostridiales bacterium]